MSEEADALLSTVISPVLASLIEALSYCTYRLRKVLHLEGYVASSLAELVQKPCSKLEEMELDKGDHISILAFFKKFRTAGGGNVIHESVALWLLLCFMKKPPSLSVSER